MNKRRVLFVTGTRADFGKLKPLLKVLHSSNSFDVFIFVTGMHMLERYGSTWREVEKSQLGRMYMFVNQGTGDDMDTALANTVSGLGNLVKELSPHLIVVHGDRVEALAGAIVGMFNRCLVAHVEGGELSGTVDETIRHAVTKMAHVHFVANDEAEQRLLQMGESPQNIFTIGSPEADVMMGDSLPSIDEVKKYYGIDFQNYGILLFHPVTTELHEIPLQIKELVDFILISNRDFVVIYPNNDDGTDLIQLEYKRLSGCPQVRLIPSMRFEYFLTAMKHADFILGNSSSGVREASVFGTPAVNLGTRQASRSRADSVIDSALVLEEIDRAVNLAVQLPRRPAAVYGDGRSALRFREILDGAEVWDIPVQKAFVDLQGYKPRIEYVDDST